jgi:iron complex transport system ATP-binding protein
MGMPYKIIKKELLRKVFGIEADIYEDKINKCPFFIPKNVII